MQIIFKIVYYNIIHSDKKQSLYIENSRRRFNQVIFLILNYNYLEQRLKPNTLISTTMRDGILKDNLIIMQLKGKFIISLIN